MWAVYTERAYPNQSKIEVFSLFLTHAHIHESDPFNKSLFFKIIFFAILSFDLHKCGGLCLASTHRLMTYSWKAFAKVFSSYFSCHARQKYTRGFQKCINLVNAFNSWQNWRWFLLNYYRGRDMRPVSLLLLNFTSQNIIIFVCILI